MTNLLMSEWPTDINEVWSPPTYYYLLVADVEGSTNRYVT